MGNKPVMAFIDTGEFTVSTVFSGFYRFFSGNRASVQRVKDMY
jgi:hypothetical protein